MKTKRRHRHSGACISRSQYSVQVVARRAATIGNKFQNNSYPLHRTLWRGNYDFQPLH